MNSNDSTGIDFGPLQGLIGTWQGDKGRDISPEPDGSEENLYRETITIDPVGDVSNAEQQKLVAVRYLQVVHRNSDAKLIHNQLGYWIWDAETRTVVQSLAIPRAVCLLAGGVVNAGDSFDNLTFEVTAKDGDAQWGIVQSPFMQDNARTVEYRHTTHLAGDQLSYSQTTVVDIYGKRFEHTDENRLTRC